jgi:hypothetical protein
MILTAKKLEVKRMQHKTRKTLKTKIAQALNDDVKHLSKGFQDMLLDDLVTAFENRLTVLNRAEQNELNLHCMVEMETSVSRRNARTIVV